MKLDPTITIDESTIDNILGKAAGFIQCTDRQLCDLKEILLDRIMKRFARDEDAQRKIRRASNGMICATDANSAIGIYNTTIQETTMPKSNDPVLPKQMLASAFGQKYANAMDSMRAPSKPAADEYQATDAQRKIWSQAFGADPAHFEAFQPNANAKAMDELVMSKSDMPAMGGEKPWVRRYKDAYERTRGENGIDMNKRYRSGQSNTGNSTEDNKTLMGGDKPNAMDKQAKYKAMYDEAKGIKRGM